MTLDRWSDLSDTIRKSFTVLAEYDEELDPGSAENLEFQMPRGRFRARFVTRPRVVGKKTLYSRRGGSSVAVDYDYSPDDVTYHLEIFQWDDGQNDWRRLDESNVFPT